MLSSILAISAAAAVAQADPTVRPRQTYMNCLTALVRRSRGDNMAPETFDTTLTTSCTNERTAYRQAIVQRETNYGASRDRAEQDADLELEDAKLNFQDLYRWHHENNSTPE